MEKAIKEPAQAPLRMKYTEVNDETIGIAADLYGEIARYLLGRDND